MRMQGSHPHGLLHMSQHLQHRGMQPVQRQSPVFLVQGERDVVATGPLEFDVTC